MTAKTSKATPAASVAVKIITGEKALMLAIRSAGERATGLQQDLHVIACSMLAHIDKHKDIRIVNALLTAIGKSKDSALRVNSMQQWLETFGKVRFEKGNPCYVDTAKTRLGDAMAKPFWKFKALEGAPYQPIKIDDYIEKQIKLLAKDAKLTNEPGKHNALIKALREHSRAVATELPN